MSTGAWVLIAAVVLAIAAGLWRMATDGRFGGTHHVKGTPHDGVEAPEAPPTAELLAALEVAPGERATLLQFSSAFCAPCRATRRVLADVAEAVPGVAHVEVDAEHHLDAVRRLGIARTPTTLVLDAAGHEVSRASGAPRKEQVLAALAAAVDGETAGHADGRVHDADGPSTSRDK
jgi:thiol-disulfide isomerase/thioredoxin